MTAVVHDDVVPTAPASRLTGAPAPTQAPTRTRQSPVGFGGDTMVDAAARLLSIPLRELYAVLWRMGLIEVVA